MSIYTACADVAAIDISNESWFRGIPENRSIQNLILIDRSIDPACSNIIEEWMVDACIIIEKSCI